KSCCRNTWARNCYNVCRLPGTISREICAKKCDCKIISGTTCPSDYPK
uniref:Thionin n=1 Tax=Pyrularia pubera TaxID=3960 RepID=THN_PYRPU|nr:RecName: Full=Thionin [Pyrularia pubera]